jgi:UDP-N-acetylmuramate--alanine ligase
MIKNSNKIYFIGIGGIGVSALARLALGMGKAVFGSDLRDSQTVADLIKLGAKISIGHDAKNIDSANPDLVVYSEDISPDSAGFAELDQARKKSISQITYARALGDLMLEQHGIAVTGTNGKSTTTAILGLILEAAGIDPTVVVGSKLSPKNTSNKFIANARLGAGKYFVAEADEYHRHMLEQKPQMIVLTNVAEDHLDYYRDIDEIKGAFAEFVKKLPTDGLVIYNADDHNAVDVGRMAHCHKFTYGIHHYADLQAINLKTQSGSQTFDLHLNDQMIGSVNLRVPGQFNVANALAAALAAIKLSVDFATIKLVLENFAGIWRRFEVVGNLGSTIIISDYAHHPAGVSGTIQAAKDFYPGKKILFVFQPHHRNRTKKLFGEFVESLTGADDLILPEIFDVAGREHGEQVSSKELVEELVKAGVRTEYCGNLSETEDLIRKKAKDFDVAVMMGAGDIDLTARRLVE